MGNKGWTMRRSSSIAGSPLLAWTWLIIAVGLLCTSVAVRPVMDDEIQVLLKEESLHRGLAAEAPSVSRSHSSLQQQVQKEESDAKHQELNLMSGDPGYVSHSEVPIVENILRLLNSDPDDLTWQWDPEADLGEKIPTYKEINYAAVDAQEALVTQLLYRHGLAIVAVSRKELYPDFLHYFAQEERPETEGRIEFAVRLLQEYCAELKSTLMQLSIPALLNLRATDIVWARKTEVSQELKSSHSFQSYQAGTSRQAYVVMQTIFGIVMQDIWSTNEAWTAFMAEFGKVGLDLNSYLIPAAIFNAKAVGEYEILQETLRLEHGFSSTTAKGWIISGQLFYPATKFTAHVDMMVTEDEKTELEAAREPMKTAGLAIRLQRAIEAVAAQHVQLLHKYPNAAANHGLGEWYMLHTSFHKAMQTTNNKPMVMPERAAKKKPVKAVVATHTVPFPPANEQDSGDYNEYETPIDGQPQEPNYENEDDLSFEGGGKAADYDNEHMISGESQPVLAPTTTLRPVEVEEALVPVEFGKVFMELNSDPEDFLFQWTEVSGEDLLDDKLQFKDLQVFGSDPAMSLALHLLFRHGFGLIYASRSQNSERFSRFWAESWQDQEEEISPVYYVRILMAFCSDFIADLLALGLKNLQILHASDSKWGLSHQASKKSLGKAADDKCSFQVEQSKQAWALIETYLHWTEKEVSDVIQAYEKFMLDFGQMGRTVGLSVQEVLFNSRSIGNRVVPHSLLRIQKGAASYILTWDDKTEYWLLQGQMEFPLSGFAKAFEIPLTDGVVETYNTFETEVQKQAFLAAHVKSLVQRMDVEHKKLLRKHQNVQWANSMYEDLLKFRHWREHIHKRVHQ